ncbi:CAP domain-containing protein [Anatilimnocola floriformis]|uniref:CAP domain-containing protein n=1 Tax=Anatilimnocola floriformis TaxID=2948575 RepID=UPI0020C58670|nr:CAP domain-containing protein [Anatilimnocola floriformis]
MYRTLIGLLLFVSGTATWLAAAENEPPALSSLERKRIDGVVAGYRAAKAQPAKLRQITTAAEISPAALNAIDEIVSKELNAGLERYRKQVAQAATAAYAKRLDQKALPEIEELRKKVLDQARGEKELTKEMIVDNSDPALLRLREILLIDRTLVVEKNPTLIKLRDTLAPLGERWQRVREMQTMLANAAPKKEGGSSEAAIAPTFAAYLAADEEQIVGLAMPMSDETRVNFATNASFESKMEPEEYRCIMALNLTRVLLGLNSLAIDPKLVLTARDHSNDMIKLDFFAHESPVKDKKTPWDRAKLFGTEASGENIAMGTTDGIKANIMWWHSPGHHKNMLGDHKRVGVGRLDRHWTEMFGR